MAGTNGIAGLQPWHGACNGIGPNGSRDGRGGNMDRAEAAQALGKVFAYLAVNKREMAREWAKRLILWLHTI